MPDLVSVQIEGPVIVVFQHQAWVSKPCTWRFGAARTGARPLMEIDLPGGDSPGELGRFSLEVRDGAGLMLLQGEQWDVRLGELAGREFTSDQGPVEALGITLAASPTSTRQDPIRWTHQVYVGSPEGHLLLRELSDRQRQPWTVEAFSTACVTALAARYPAARFQLREPLVIDYEVEGKAGTMNLHNQWEGASGDPARVEEQIHQRLAMFSDTLAGVIRARDRVVAQAKHQTDVARLTAMAGSDHPVLQHLAGEVWLQFAIDLPHAIAPMRESDRTELGLEEAELRDLAAANLLALHPDIRLAGVPGQTYFMLTCGGDYEASMLLLPEVWTAVLPHLDGDPVVAIPNRDLLLITGSRQPDLIETMREVAVRSHAEGTYPVSPELLVRRDGQWAPWDAEG